MQTIQGIYKDGRIVLSELPREIDEAQVLVTFLQPAEIDLQARGINEEHARELRGKFSTIAEDWNDSAMDVYDVD